MSIVLVLNMDSNNTGFALIKALSQSRAYEHEITAVSIVETHISWVLLTGQYAYKIKKPVNFGFLGFFHSGNDDFL